MIVAVLVIIAITLVVFFLLRKPEASSDGVNTTITTSNVDFIEEIVAKEGDLKNGQMQECKLGTGRVLLIKDDDQFFAVGPKCSHASASLKSGTYSKGRVRCPRHGACFDVKTGDIEDYPGCDSIPVFDVRVEDGDVIVRGERALVETRTPFVTKEMVTGGKSDELVIIVGGGGAGATCAEVLRQEGFEGRIVVLNRDAELPYNRPKLSKVLGLEIEKAVLRPSEFYEKYNIEFRLGVSVESLNPDEQTVKCSDGETFRYDHAVIATGADPQTLKFIPGYDATNIYPFRTITDSKNILDTYQGKDVVIVGSSFIGMETAAAIVKKAARVRVIGMENVPFERVLGYRIGEITQQLHEANNVEFILNAVVAQFVKEGDVCKKIILRDGTELDVDIIILGAGVIPNFSFLGDSDLVETDPRSGIMVNEYLETGAPGLYAAGDLANFPFPLMNGHRVRIEHWGMAKSQGKIVARNILGKKEKCTNIPFFWTTVFGKTITYVGHALEYDYVLFDGPTDQSKPTFIAFYVHEGRTLAVCASNKDPACAMAAEIMNAGVDILEQDIRKALEAPEGTFGLLKDLLANL